MVSSECVIVMGMSSVSGIAKAYFSTLADQRTGGINPGRNHAVSCAGDNRGSLVVGRALDIDSRKRHRRHFHRVRVALRNGNSAFSD